MSSTRENVRGRVLGSLAGGLVFAAVAATPVPASAAPTDTTPPTVPTNLRQIGTDHGQAVLGWDPSTDDSGSIHHYWVRADGRQVQRPSQPTVKVSDLVAFCHLIPGRTYSFTVLAVDAAGNRSAPSAPLEVAVP